jgi:hypothetical protein
VEFPTPRGIPVLVVERVSLKTYGNLAQVAQAANRLPSLFGFGKSGQEHGRQDCDDRNDHQELDQSKTWFFPKTEAQAPMAPITRLVAQAVFGFVLVSHLESNVALCNSLSFHYWIIGSIISGQKVGLGEGAGQSPCSFAAPNTNY